MSRFIPRGMFRSGGLCISEGLLERELHADALKCKDIMDLIKAVGLLKTLTKVGRCYDRFVKEFIVNVGPEVSLKGHEDFCKVYVRGNYVQFSAAEINKYLEGVIQLKKKKR